MKILSPAVSAHEVEAVIAAGAGEIYCGVMPDAWRKAYTNVASPNRREWEVSNMTDFEALADAVNRAHDKGVPVFLTLNALYTEAQYPELRHFVEKADACGVDALIIADLGLLLLARDMGWKRDLHISTGGTAFNTETVDFYRNLGAARVIIPRQNRLSEIAHIAQHAGDTEIETFILNRGCKNIDGFCTFHHGVNEVRIPLWWRLPKKLHWDYYLLNWMKRLPAPVRDRIAHSPIFGSVGACFLSYDIDVASDDAPESKRETVHTNLRRNFNLFTGLDTCGACGLWDMLRAGVDSLKIVGRSNPLDKKVKDVAFLAACMERAANMDDKAEFVNFAKRCYRKTYGFPCDKWCYFPEEDSQIEWDAL
ncbi:MAG: U32 family peptidase [Verrucomicrobia bacterium]|jgi:U32 family peptidase|nr:U32 family peptidase [Verrucomicrobiota bacterium]